ncbi:MAG TPA: peptidyl-prolyl cis-trans isomerase [bacterium]|nr:peptidyl-prolyl cis-trans isomerase [bacterium]
MIPRRSVRTLVVGVTMAVALAACQGTPGDSAPARDRVLARVAGKVIRESDVDARLAELPTLARPEYSSPIGKERLLRQMVEEEMLYRAAVEDGLDQDPTIASRLERSRRQILTQAYLDHMQEEASRVPDDEARAFYREHLDEYHIERMLRVRVLHHSDRNIVERARDMVVEHDRRFAEVCAEINEKSMLKDAAGLLPNWVRRDKAVPWLGNLPEFHDAVWSLAPGEMSPVVETVQGFLIAVVEEERPARQRTFEEARADVVGRISRERSTRGLPELIDELEERYSLEMVAAPEKSAEELFAAAQAAPGATRKVELFEELVERYPEDERVLEALFMIGFTRSEELGDSAGARVAFERVVREFPDSELAQSAQWMLSSGEGAPEFDDEE